MPQEFDREHVVSFPPSTERLIGEFLQEAETKNTQLVSVMGLALDNFGDVVKSGLRTARTDILASATPQADASSAQRALGIG